MTYISTKHLLYLHVGFPKTWISSIQSFLNANREKLQQEDIYYPPPLVGPLFSWHEGHCSLLECDSTFRFDQTSWKQYRKKYLDSILAAKYRINILSAEGFLYDDSENTLIFCEHFHIVIICYFRNIFDFLISGQKQLIKEVLCPDLFQFYQHRDAHILVRIESYLQIFGIENFIFKNYDELRKDGILLDDFLQTIGVCSNKYKDNVVDKNITPSDVATRFLYQLAFLPIARQDFEVIREDLLRLDLSKWHNYRCTCLPPSVFSISSSFEKAVQRQGELLHAPDWYDKTLSRGKALADIPNKDLPPEVQYFILTHLSDSTRNTLTRYWPKTGRETPSEPFLPSMENIPSEPFELLTSLQSHFSIFQGDNFRLEQIIEKQHKEEQKIVQERQQALLRKTVTGFRVIWKQFVECFRSVFSSLARQAYIIRQSGLFDIPWYLANNSDVASAGIDPITHYVQYGSKEGRNPTPWFSTSTYIFLYSDVEKSNLNHFFTTLPLA